MRFHIRVNICGLFSWTSICDRIRMSARARVGLEQVNLVVSMLVEELAQQRGKYCENSETRGGGPYPCCTKTRDARADYCYFHFMSASNAVEGKVEKEEVLGIASILDRALA